MAVLSETRKADRPKMAAKLAEVVRAAGGQAKIAPVPYKQDAILVSIIPPGGGRVSVDFDGKSSQPNVFVLNWCIDIDSDDRFNPVHWASINNYH